MFGYVDNKWGLTRQLQYTMNNIQFIYTIPLDQAHRREQVWKTYAYDMYDTLDLDEEQFFEVKKASYEQVKQTYEQDAKNYIGGHINEHLAEN